MFGTIKAQLAEMTGFEVERGRQERGAVVVSECLYEKKKKEVTQKTTVGRSLLRDFE